MIKVLVIAIGSIFMYIPALLMMEMILDLLEVHAEWRYKVETLFLLAIPVAIGMTWGIIELMLL